MQKFNKKLKPVFLGLSISMLFSFNAHAGIDGWKFENNHWKYYKEAKSLKAWQHINNTWYFFNEDGSLKTGWYLDAGNNWYFLDSSKNVNQGALLTGWQWIDGYCYYFEGVDKARLGRMYANTAVDGYKLGTTGRWIDENGVEHYESGKGISTNTAGNNLKQKSLNTTGRSGGSGGGGSSRGGASGSGGSSRGGVSSKGGGSNGGDSGRRSEAVQAQASHDSILSQSDSSKKDGITGSSSQENEYGNLNNTVGNTFDNKDKSEQNNIGTNNTAKENSTTSDNTDTQSSNKPQMEDNNNSNSQPEGNKNIVQPGNNKNEAAEPGRQGSENQKNGNKEKNSLQPATSSNAEKTQEQNNKNTDVQDNSNKTAEEQEQDKLNKAEKIKNSLTTAKNDNVVQYTNESGEIRTIIWAKGINAPTMGENGDFQKEVTNSGSDTYVDYKAPFVLGNSWFDVNKTKAGGNVDVDKNLCFGAVASNMLHWWFEQNSEYVDRYIAKNGDITRANRQLSVLKSSFKSQQSSGIFELFKVLFGHNDKGFYSDLLMDLFINGYTPKAGGGTNPEREDLTPDNRGGFFYDVFKGGKLTERTYGGNYEALSDILKETLGNEGLIGLSHKAFTNSNHIVTLWGAEYDLNGKLKAVYISDSDDQNEGADENNLGMKRYEVRNVGGVAKVSTNQTNKASGSTIGYLHILYLGSTQWESYFKN